MRDEGPGFDVQNSLDVSLGDDETAGRGLVLMWGLMDKVIYNKVGNEVTLIKKCAGGRHLSRRPPTLSRMTADVARTLKKIRSLASWSLWTAASRLC